MLPSPAAPSLAAAASHYQEADKVQEPPWQGIVTRGRGRPGVSDGFPGLLSARLDPSRLRRVGGARAAGMLNSQKRLLSLGPRVSASPVCRKHSPAAPGLDKLSAFYLAAAEITQLCAGRNNLRRFSSMPAFLVVPRFLPFPLARHSHSQPGMQAGRRGAALLWVGWFFSQQGTH